MVVLKSAFNFCALELKKQVSFTINRKNSKCKVNKCLKIKTELYEIILRILTNKVPSEKFHYTKNH